MPDFDLLSGVNNRLEAIKDNTEVLVTELSGISSDVSASTTAISANTVAVESLVDTVDAKTTELVSKSESIVSNTQDISDKLTAGVPIANLPNSYPLPQTQVDSLRSLTNDELRASALSVSVTNIPNVSVFNFPATYALPSTQLLQLTPQTNSLTDAQLRAAPVPVSLAEGSVTISSEVEIKNDVGNPVPVAVNNLPASYPLPESQVAQLTPQTNSLTDAQLRALAIHTIVDNFPAEYALPSSQVAQLTPQTNGLTDAQLRATPVPVSLAEGSVTISSEVEIKNDVGNPIPTTVSNFPAEYALPSAQLTQLTPQNNALTDAQLRATAVSTTVSNFPTEYALPSAQVTQLTPQTNALTNAQLRATELTVAPFKSNSATIANSLVTSVVATQATAISTANSYKKRIFCNNGATKVYLHLGTAPTLNTASGIPLSPNQCISEDVFNGAIFAIADVSAGVSTVLVTVTSIT